MLLLDEPFGALDAKIREELRRAIREIQRAVGITTILVTHDQEEAFSMADRIGVMDRGRLQEVGEPRALYQRPGTRFVATFLGAANLLLGPYGYRDVQLGESFFEVDRWSRSLRSGDEAAVVVRPEDVVLAEHRDELDGARCGQRRRSSELQFVGAIERLRIEVAASATLASAQRPGAATLSIEASRTAPEVELLPLAIGQQRLRRLQAHARAADADQQPARRRRTRAYRRSSSRPRRSCGSSPSACTSSRCPTTPWTDGARSVRGLPVVTLRSRRGLCRRRSACSSAALVRCSPSATVGHRSSEC